MSNLKIINASAGYRHRYGIVAQQLATQEADTRVILIGRGPLISGRRIETGECWPCTRAGYPERLPDLWVWEPEAVAEIDDLRDVVQGWTGLCNQHAQELYSVSMTAIPPEEVLQDLLRHFPNL